MGGRGRAAADHYWDSLDLRIHRVTVDDDLDHNVVLAGRQLAVKLDLERQVLPRTSRARQHDPTVSIQHHVAAFGGSALEEDGVNLLHRSAQDAVVAHHLHEDFNVGGEGQSAG